MTRSPAYRIVDEPTPSRWQQFVVAPLFPMLSAMLAGQWLAWPWFVFNGAVLGSANRRKEVGVVVLAALGAALLTTIALILDADDSVPDVFIHLVILGLTTWKLGCAYWLQQLQTPSHELFQYWGGQGLPGRTAMIVVAIAMFVVRPWLFGVVDSLWLKLIISGGL